MSRLPDRFDLLVRKVREGDFTPDRQIDFLLAAFFTLKEAHLINAADEVSPLPTFLELDEAVLMPVFTSADQADTYTSERGQRGDHDDLCLISMPPAIVLDYAESFTSYGCKDWFINPGPFGFIISLQEAQAYQQQKNKVGQRPDIGFWIPNLTSQEEAFWEDNGL